MFGGCKRPIHSAPAGSACEGFFFRGHWYQALLNQAYGGAGSLWPALNPPLLLVFCGLFSFFFCSDQPFCYYDWKSWRPFFFEPTRLQIKSQKKRGFLNFGPPFTTQKKPGFFPKDRLERATKS